MTDRDAMETASWEESDTRTPDEKLRDAMTFARINREYQRSAHRRQTSPTPIERHLDAVAFGAAVLDRFPALPRTNADHVFIAMVGERVKQRGGRPIHPRSEWDVLRTAARAIADAVRSVEEAA